MLYNNKGTNYGDSMARATMHDRIAADAEVLSQRLPPQSWIASRWPERQSPWSSKWEHAGVTEPTVGKHILSIPSWYSSRLGSGGGYFRDQALALQSAGMRVAMLAPAIYTRRNRRRGRLPPGGPGASIEEDGIDIHRRNDFVGLPRFPYRDAWMWSRCGLRGFADYVAAHGLPDLVHAHCCLYAGVLAAAIARRWRVPFILTEHSTSYAQGRLRWWQRDLTRRVIRRAQRCLAVSPDLALLLERQYPGSRWHYVPNVLGPEFIGEVPAAAPPGGPFTFVCVARFTPEKGHAALLDAFAEAFPADPQPRLVLVGDGPMRPALQRQAAGLGMGARVDFAGVLPAAAVRRELAAADAFVLASTVETFGVAVIEALATGLPVVCTASGGPDHLIGAANGLLVRCGDGPALRDALLRMRRAAACYDRAAIRADALGRFGPAAFARQFIEIMAGAGARPAGMRANADPEPA
jgi:teichuronic acid biosynthesis glycosyltransferase TuaC